MSNMVNTCDETIFWANGADIALEWLYNNGIDVSVAIRLN